MQLHTLIVLFGVMLQIVEFGEAYKYTRPYKYYNPRPWRSLRWYPFPKTPTQYRSEKMPTHPYEHRDPYESNYDRRYAPLYDDFEDAPGNGKPYIVFIQLLREKEKQQSRPYQRLHVEEPYESSRETDYIDDDNKLKVYQLDDKKLRIKVNDQLSILAI